MDRLKGKVALVTGAARGIGAAIAKAFVEEGANVLVTDIDAKAGLESVAALGPRARFWAQDVTLEEQWEATMAHTLSVWGRLDILVNNAGVSGAELGRPQDPENISFADWKHVHATNLDGTFLGCRAAIRVMRPQGQGCILNMSSRSGLVGVPGTSAYASAKAAIRNYTKSVALWCAQEGLAIRCNSIHPAAVMTPIWEPMLGTGEEREKRIQDMLRGMPLHRFGRPEEVASLCVFLASDEAPYITGSEYNIDGGILAGSAAAPRGQSPSQGKT